MDIQDKHGKPHDSHRYPQISNGYSVNVHAPARYIYGSSSPRILVGRVSKMFVRVFADYLVAGVDFYLQEYCWPSFAVWPTMVGRTRVVGKKLINGTNQKHYSGNSQHQPIN